MCECVKDMPSTCDKPEVWHAAYLVDTGQVEIGGISIAILDAYFKAWDRQGREAERQRILEFLKNWTVRGDDDYAIGYRDALSAVIAQVLKIEAPE